MQMERKDVEEHSLYDSFMNFKWMALAKDSKCIRK